MLLNLPAGHCIPFEIADDDDETGPRIGGRAPAGIVPPKGEDTRYVLTVSLTSDQELSIFAHFNRDLFADLPNDNFFPRHNSEQVFKNDTILSLILHGPSMRAEPGSAYASDMAPHRLAYEPMVLDTEAARYSVRPETTLPFVESPLAPIVRPGQKPVNLYYLHEDKVNVVRKSPEEANMPLHGFKLGGSPAAGEPDTMCGELDRQLRGNGYRFVLQLKAGYGRGWPGDPLFYDCGPTYIYARKWLGKWDWAYFWHD